MKKLNTLKKIFTLALCAAVAAASFTSCSDGTENSADTAAVLTLSVAGTSRSVLPSADLASLTSLSLTGIPDGGTVATLGTWSSYSDMTAAQIAVAPGTWSFTLNASNSGAALSGTVTGRTVTAGTNALSFSLAVSSYTQTSTGTGNIAVSLTYAPGSVAEVTAGLFTSDGNAVSGYGAETVTPTDSGSNKTVSYTKSGVPSGTYVLVFKFYGGTGETLFLNRWRESVTVADGLTSSASVTVENLNTMYDIAYVYNGGSLKAGETATLSYVGKTGATLTAAEKVERTGYTFAGWYGDSACTGSAVTEIAAGQSGKKTFYAKWNANVYYLTIDAQSGSCAYTKLYEKYDTGWYTDEACTNEITSDTVLTVPTKSGYAFVGIYGATDGSGDCYITAAGKKTDAVTNTIINDNSVTLYAVWKEATPPAAVTSLTATTGSAQVTLHWTNPADSDFSKAVVEYATTADTATVLGTYEAAGTAGAAGTYTVTGLTNGTSYTFTVYAQDGAGNRSGGASVKATAGCYVAEDGSMVINGTELDKTGVAAVIATGSTATVSMTDDSSWSGYYTGSYAYYKGVFLSGRKVQLSAYAMGQYEVTQELYAAVTGSSPSYFTSGAADGETQSRRPVEKVSWYDAIVFCNKLSVLMGYDPCYTIKVEGSATSDTSKWGTVPTGTSTVWDAAVCDLTKNGYRLPTEAEWEYAARGGDAAASAWKYPYAGVAAVTGTTDITSSNTDANLAGYAWYTGNSGSKTHEAGKKGANALGLYDMSGNVFEWCWDWYADATLNDSAYTKDGVVVDPLGAASGSCRVLRGGCWYSISYYCAVSDRSGNGAYGRGDDFGFRVCRSGL